jgi:hypothetical protein
MEMGRSPQAHRLGSAAGYIASRHELAAEPSLTGMAQPDMTWLFDDLVGAGEG